MLVVTNYGARGVDNVDLSTTIGHYLLTDGRATCGQCGQCGQSVFKLSNLSTKDKGFLGKGKRQGEKAGNLWTSWTMWTMPFKSLTCNIRP